MYDVLKWGWTYVKSPGHCYTAQKLKDGRDRHVLTKFLFLSIVCHFYDRIEGVGVTVLLSIDQPYPTVHVIESPMKYQILLSLALSIGKSLRSSPFDLLTVIPAAAAVFW
jgi:hypothetical protein